MPQSPRLLWDVFCRVIDNHGDIGVCWRLACALADGGQRVRLWVDDARALQWMAPGALQGEGAVQVRSWADACEPNLVAALAPADAWVEAFGCELPPAFVAARARRVRAGAGPAPVWINLEYLSAESFSARAHGLPSPVQAGPAAGWTKWFFYPGFTPATGGLLRPRAVLAGADARATWLAAQGIDWQGERLLSLFCYEPAALGELLHQLQGQAARMLVTPGRAARALRRVLRTRGSPAAAGSLHLHWLPHLPQPDFDRLLQACNWNFVRGEDSLVQALWAGRPFVWQIYPQHDGAHGIKLRAFLDWLQAPTVVRHWHGVWAGLEPGRLPNLDDSDWQQWGDCVRAARHRLVRQGDLATRLIEFARLHRS